MRELDVFGTLDHPLWQTESDYSTAIASLIKQAAVDLTNQGAHGPVRQRALQRLTRSLHRPMSAHQRQRVCYLLGRASAAALDYQRAISHLEKALQLALDIDDVAASAESAFALAGVHSAQHRFGAAVNTMEICVVMLAAAGYMEPDASAALLTQAADATLALATCEYVRGHFDAVEHWLDQADALIPRLPDRLAASGSSAATRALLARARGQPEVALRQALAALDLAEVGQGAPPRWARGLAAECALDLVELLAGGPAGGSGRALLALARGYVDTPPHLPVPGARREDTPPLLLADGVAYLASMRYLRLAGAAAPADRLVAFEHLLAAAERYDNNAILGLTFSALGDDLAACGARIPALRSYEAALRAIEGHDIAAIGLRARRALLRHRETYLDN